jgi:hypothetical protein
MFFDEREILVRAERFKDWQRRAAERQRFNQMVRPEHPANKTWHNLANWLGTQMIKWGLKLQQFDPASPSKVVSTE